MSALNAKIFEIIKSKTRDAPPIERARPQLNSFVGPNKKLLEARSEPYVETAFGLLSLTS
jgi:hypothetical protein